MPWIAVRPRELDGARARLDVRQRRRRVPRPSRRPSARRRRRPRPRGRPPSDARPRGAGAPRSSPSLELGKPSSGITLTTDDATPVGLSATPVMRTPGVRLVALVHVHDHRRQPLERAGARERPAVDRAARGDPLRQLEHERLRVGVVAAHERVLLRRLVGAEVPRGERVEARDDRAVEPSWIRAAIDVASAVGSTPPGVNVSSAATESTGVVPIASRSSSAVSSVASAFVARTTRSARPGGVRVRRALGPDLGACRPGALGVARADHDVVPRLDEAPRERGAEAARAADDGDLHAAASSTVSASRAAATRSVISVSVTTSGTVGLGGSVRRVDHERVDQARVAVRHVSRCRPARHAREHTVERALDRAATDQRAHGDAASATRRERLPDRRDGEDRAERDVRVARRDHDRVGVANRLEHAGRRARLVRAVERRRRRPRPRAACRRTTPGTRTRPRGSSRASGAARPSRGRCGSRRRPPSRACRSRPRAARRSEAPASARGGARGRGRRAGTSPRRPSSFADSSVRHVSPARPQPRSSSFSPASA